MAGAKKAVAAPIDRPLSRAYLRKFTGWSTAYPPGLSQPTSLRTMHNCSVAADGSVRIRPGLRTVLSAPADGDIVGSFEHFYIDGGATHAPYKALLFAVRETDNSVGFRVAYDDDDDGKMTVFPASSVFTIPAGDELNFQKVAGAGAVKYVRYVQIDNKILALSDNDEPFRLFRVGATKQAKVVREITKPAYTMDDRVYDVIPTQEWIDGPQTTIPTWVTRTADTLQNVDRELDIYKFGYFYTFNNDIGESAPSMVRPVNTQRRWSNWWVDTTDETKSEDQIVLVIPETVWTAAVAQGALSWNLYFFTWTDQDPVPTEGMLIKTTSMLNEDGSYKTYQIGGWASHTPLLQGLDGSKPLPTPNTLDNYTAPSAAGQGLVAGDRLVLVYDRTQAARIKWSSNRQGDYLNFSPSKGGGYKTLTSGNLFTPAAVKLWQNPQSVDTLTVLCMGLDGYGTAYYMNPNTTVGAQNQTTTIMGFEETTATPGTVSPFGCEVVNNALYHPLDNNLMKSTAANYNINHATMADPIQNIWQQVPAADKRMMVSASMDSTLYYLVKSPVAWASQSQATGNQVWMCDTALSNTWSCWDVEGTSLRKLELGGLLYMAITSGPNIFVFDQEQDHDDVWVTSAWTEAGIPWEIVTNTQGANKAHDAWCNLQQVNVTFGNFTGECDYGIRGRDLNGQMIEVKKHFVAPVKGHDPLDRYDQSDFLLVRRILKEWEFFWRSSDRPKNRSYGSVNFVQYRYTPVSVNVGYEYGSIETFEYGQRDVTTSNGVPLPFADTSKP